MAIFSTIFFYNYTPARFIEVASVKKEKLKLFSSSLLLATFIALILALRNKESIFLAGMVSFVALRAFQIILKFLLSNDK